MRKYVFKVIAIGDGRVGKTSISMRYVHDKFDPEYKTTIGVSYALKKLVIQDTQVLMTIWDTGGQELFDFVRPRYFSNANGGLLVYDVTNEASFDSLGKWFDELYEQCGKISLILVGNKIDLTDERVISTEEGERYARQKGVTFYETSAKTGEKIIDVMEELCKSILSEGGTNVTKTTSKEIL